MDPSSGGSKHTDSKIFCGFRSLGHVSNHIPCLVRYIFKRRKNFIVGCTGQAFNTFESQQMKMLTVSDTHEAEITCMAADTYHVYTAANKKIFAWRRGTELKHTYEGHESDIVCLLPMGEYILSIDDGGTLAMFHIVDEDCKWTVEYSAEFKPTCIVHPNTYINKVVIGSSQGTLEIFDFNSVLSVHRFKGWNSPILAMAQSPKKEVLAVCLANKSIVFHNIGHDETVLVLKCLETPISLAFRSDRNDTLIVGGDKGSLSVWDIKSGEMTSFKQDAHKRPVTGIQCFHQEPLFATSSSDNSIQIWIFDMPDGGYRLYSSRSGHCKPSNRIRFYGSPSSNIVSAGSDGTLRIFHIYNETYSRCISKAKIPLHNLKMKPTAANREEFMPEILDFTDESVTNPDHHGSLAAIHAGQANLTTWSLAKMKREKIILVPTNENNAKSATCVCISSCGQFIIAGYENGFVHRFNIQSGKHRMTYGKRAAHELSVEGVAINQVNTTVATGGIDRKVKFWNFGTGELINVYEFSSGIFNMFFHRVSDLVGVILDNCSLVVMDINSMKVFRKFDELSSPILCACFSPDNRWVTASTSDGLIRTWDLSTSSLIDVFRLQSLATSLDYSPNGEFLAMTLNDSVGIFLWVNKTLYDYVSLMPLPPDFEPSFEMESVAMEVDEHGEVINQEYKSLKQIHKSMATLSLLPGTKWKNLLNLDVIKMRNRPKQPPKTYIAPFFLSTLIPTGEGSSPVVEAENGTLSTSKIIRTRMNHSIFGQKLGEIRTSKSCDQLCEMLAAMSPTEIENEIVALAPLGGGSIELMKDFLIFIAKLVRSNQVFEGSEAYLGLFLKIHGDIIRSEETLREELQKVQTLIGKRDEKIRQEVTSVLAFTYYLKSTLLT